MFEHASMIAEVRLVEVVHVELPHERGKPIMAEVFGQDDLFQFLLVEDPNALMLGIPVDDLGVLLGLH